MTFVVTEAFNPYREWLGLDTDARDLNHYQLFDLPELEENAAKIHAAAERALVRVRSHRPGAQAAAWARLLDTLAAAKTCLTDPAQKSVYDDSLRSGKLQPPETAHSPHQDRPVREADRAPEEDASMVPQVAIVNQSPDLFPPGMQPSARPQTASTPARSPSASSERGVPTSSEASSRSSPPAATAPLPTHKARKKTPPPLPPTDPSTASAAGAPTEAATVGGPSMGDVSTPVPPAPMNAHVAPPRRQQQSLLPIVVSIAAVLIVITLIVMLLAMGGTRSDSSAVTPSPAQPSPVQPSPAGSFAGLAPAGSARLPTSPLQPPGPAGTGVPDSVDPIPQVASEQPLANSSSHPPPPLDSEQQPDAISVSPGTVAQSPLAGSAEPAVPATDPTLLPLLTIPSDPTNFPTPPTPETDPAPPSHTDLAHLGQSLTSARQALAEHRFETARKELAVAESLAVLPQHKALVQRTRRLAECGERFWNVVANVVTAFKGAEELTVGASKLMVIVVETGPGSITIRSQGRNTRYTFTAMPPGLALAIAKQQLDIEDPDALVLLGACLAMVADQKPEYLEEAHKYWTRAQMAGAEVDNLLLTLTDSYDLAP